MDAERESMTRRRASGNRSSTSRHASTAALCVPESADEKLRKISGTPASAAAENADR